MSKSTLYVDGQNILYRAAYGVAARYGSYDLPVHGPDTVSSFFHLVRSAMWRFMPDHVFIVWDGGRSNRRTSLYSDYKISRKVMPQSVSEGRARDIRSINLIVRSLGCRVLSFPGREADDVIAFLSRIVGEGVILSSDRDFYQLINKRIGVYTPPPDDTFYSLCTFIEKFKFHPSQYLLFRAILGDKSDNIQGVLGVGEKTVEELFTETNATTAQELFNHLESKKKLNRRESLILESSRKRVLHRNLDLLDTAKETFNNEEVDVFNSSIVRESRFDEPRALRFLMELGCESVVKMFTDWSIPFRRLS